MRTRTAPSLVGIGELNIQPMTRMYQLCLCAVLAFVKQWISDLLVSSYEQKVSPSHLLVTSRASRFTDLRLVVVDLGKFRYKLLTISGLGGKTFWLELIQKCSANVPTCRHLPLLSFVGSIISPLKNPRQRSVLLHSIYLLCVSFQASIESIGSLDEGSNEIV